MNRRSSWLIVLAIAAPCADAQAPAETQTRNVVTVQDAPNALSAPVGVLEKGATVQVLECGTEYLQIRRERDGVAGYVEKAAVTRLVCPQAEGTEPDPGATMVIPRRDPAADETLADAGQLVPTEPVAQESFPVGEEAFREASVPVAADQQSGWYLSLSAGTARNGTSKEELAAALRPHASVVDVRFMDKQTTSWGLTLGFALSQHWRIEGSLMDLGSYDSVIDLRDPDEPAVRRVLSEQYPIGGTGVQARVIGGRDLGAWVFSGSAGFFQSFSSEVDLTVDGQVLTIKGASSSPSFGLSAWYRINPAWQLGVVGSYMALNQDILQTSVGLRLAL